ISPDYIMPTMDETEVFAHEAADVAMEAVKNGVARLKIDWQGVYDKTLADIDDARSSMKLLMDQGFIKEPPNEMLEKALKIAINSVK
ncbi:MAG: malate dehydrogenase, partial [Candidatus Aminicenantes bacterium]|nr:malate dehydrogenase [Candidatus Aminicenantes bacterium]